MRRYTIHCERLMSENERQSQIKLKDKLQGTLVTYLRCGGIVNNQINPNTP